MRNGCAMSVSYADYSPAVLYFLLSPQKQPPFIGIDSKYMPLYIIQGPRGKQKFVPWGQTYLGCGFVIADNPIELTPEQLETGKEFAKLFSKQGAPSSTYWQVTCQSPKYECGERARLPCLKFIFTAVCQLN
jgi:hypothetical protein